MKKNIILLTAGIIILVVIILLTNYTKNVQMKDEPYVETKLDGTVEEIDDIYIEAGIEEDMMQIDADLENL